MCVFKAFYALKRQLSVTPYGPNHSSLPQECQWGSELTNLSASRIGECSDPPDTSSKHVRKSLCETYGCCRATSTRLCIAPFWPRPRSEASVAGGSERMRFHFTLAGTVPVTTKTVLGQKVRRSWTESMEYSDNDSP